MVRHWGPPYTYETALAHLTRYRNNQQLLIDGSGAQLARETDSMVLRWRWSEMPIVRWYKDGRVFVYEVGSWPSQNLRINQYALRSLEQVPPFESGWILVGTKNPRFLDFSERTPSRRQRCSHCHGYQREDDETEARLHELICRHEGTVTIRYTWGSEDYHQCDSKTARLHYRPCVRCDNGYVTVGNKPKGYPIPRLSTVEIVGGVPQLDKVESH